MESSEYMADELECLAHLEGTELGEWWSGLAYLHNKVLDFASDEFRDSYIKELRKEFFRLNREFKVVEDEVTETRVVKRLLHVHSYGWFCTLYYGGDDAPEPEGVVWFPGKPEVGERFRLPSSGYEEEWQVRSVDENEMTFTAEKPHED